MGQVRAILWQHLYETRQGAPCAAEDPNTLLAATDFSAALGHEPDLRLLAHSYIKLWARTFRTLVRQIRGQPDRALAVFVEEVYPYLRGRRLAMRTQPDGHKARLIVDDDLPLEYVAGLAEAFVALSGAQVEATVDQGAVLLDVKLPARDHAARWMSHVARLRIPLLLTSLLAACAGLAGVRGANPLTVAAVLLGTLAAQSGANALHDLLRPPVRHILGPAPIRRRWLWLQAIASYLTAAGSLAWLASERIGVLGFAAAGLVVTAGYAALRDRGWGPAMAGLSHGPMIVLGAAYAIGGWASIDARLLWATAPLGLLAASMRYLDDIADRPLDEAGGNRTLVVRLTPGARTVGFGTLLGAGLLAALAWLATNLPMLLVVAGLAVPASWIWRRVQGYADEPTRLASPRFWTLFCYTIVALAMTLTYLEIP